MGHFFDKVKLSRETKIILILFLFVVFATYLFIGYFRNQNLISSFQKSKETDTLQSYFNDKNDYDITFAKFANRSTKKILAGVTSHHYLAKDYIAEFFTGIDPSGIKNIIVVGPDHFQSLSSSPFLANTTNSDWSTPYGILPSDTKTIFNLSQDNRFKIYTNIFRMEHSIYTLIPFIKYTFPNAAVTPIILKSSSNYDAFYSLGQFVNKIVDKKETILIVSSDFTHNSTPEESLKNDLRSIVSLEKGDKKDLDSITNDCRQCISFLYGYLSDQNYYFETVSNSSSYHISGIPNNVSSYVNGYFIRKN